MVALILGIGRTNVVNWFIFPYQEITMDNQAQMSGAWSPEYLVHDVFHKKKKRKVP